MDSTSPAYISYSRTAPSPDWADDIEPLASTESVAPPGTRW